jgi:glucose-6-phosphate 1-dehydrogenase
MGATGDLARRKLFPALAGLFGMGYLAENSRIMACGRREMDDDGFRGILRHGGGPAADERFCGRVAYHRLDFGDPSTFSRLRERMKEPGRPANRLFYLALPPSSYEDAATGLGRAGLAREEDGWSRIVIEKPFGHDLDSARRLNRVLHAHFREEQVFRIDHYLAKETVQNILVFRFANAVFEPLWNRQYIDSVAIMATETLGVGGRAAYYDSAGVLRDMFQNHLLQLLALTAMEPPARFEAGQVQDEKVKVFRSLKPIGPADLVTGQYGQGTVEGRKVPAYVDEPGVAPASRTPTFARLTARIDNWRWRGVPFVMVSGKRLGKKVTRMVINFRRVPHSMFRGLLAEDVPRNRLFINIYPDEGIALSFQGKAPGGRFCLGEEMMRFDFAGHDQGLDAYGRALVDCLHGERMLFWRQDGIEAAWRYLAPALERCGRTTPAIYPAGTYGPAAEHEFIAGMVENP